MTADAKMNATFPELKRAAIVAGALGIVGLGAGFFVAPDQFFKSYLLGFSLFLALSLGCLSVSMLHNMTGGAWGFVVRRILEAGMANLPVMAALFVPILMSLPKLYVWARPEEVAGDHVLQHKSVYLNPSFFTIRAAIYFAIWCGFAALIRRWSREQDQAADGSKSADKMSNLGGPGLVIFAITVTFASVDFLMSLEPKWFSTIYALLHVVIQALMAIAFGVAIAALLKGTAALRTHDAEDHFHDLGNLMLAFVMLWAYMMLSQYLIIWSGNQPEEIPWYIARSKSSWGIVATLLVAGHFALPFVFLLFRANKRSLRSLSALACFLLAMIVVDFVWFVSPAFYPDGVHLHWLDFAAIVGIGGIWIYFFAMFLEGRPLVPVHDPELPAAFTGAPEGGASHGHA